MRFHFCTEGETLLSVAREEGISPVRLIEENALCDPDRLAVGQCLAIYTPSRIYTVRGGDTLRSVCTHLGKSEAELRRFNPSIGERGLLYPGQALVLGRGAPPLGAISVLGMIGSQASPQFLRNFISALTYLAIIPDSCERRSGWQIPKSDTIVSLARQNHILPLLSVPAFAVTDELLSALSKKGYAGILLECESEALHLADSIAAGHRHGLAVGLMGAREQETDADLIVPFGLPNEGFLSRCRRICCEEGTDVYRALIPLPERGTVLPGECDANSPLLSDCAALAYRRNARITRDRDERPQFTFTHTKHGVTETKTLVFEDLASIRKGLTVIGESGAAGVALRLERISPAVGTLLSHSFDIIRA